MDYETGLRALKSRLPRAAVGAFNVLEARLRDNLSTEQRYGSTEATRADRAHILDGLNQLAQTHAGQSFNDLCQTSPIPAGTGPSAMAAVKRFAPFLMLLAGVVVAIASASVLSRDATPTPTPTLSPTQIASAVARFGQLIANNAGTATARAQLSPAPTSAGLLPPSARIARALLRVSPDAPLGVFSMGFAISRTAVVVAGMPVGPVGRLVSLTLAVDPNVALSARVRAIDVEIGLAVLEPQTNQGIIRVHLASARGLKTGQIVHLYSLTQGFHEGVVEEIDASVTIAATDWGDGLSTGERTLRGMLQTTSIAVGGDIGTPVFDASGNAIGIVVAGSGTTSIILPMERLCQKFWNDLIEACQ